MKTTTKYDRLLKYMYEEYDKGHHAHGYGEYLRVLVSHFERISQTNRIGDAHAQMAAVNYLRKNGWLDAVDILGNNIIDHLRAYNTGRMQPTPKGREYLQQKRMYTANAVASVFGTFFGKLFKSLFLK